MNQLALLREIGALHDVIVSRLVDGMRMFCVMSEDRTRSFGCYATRERAERRLREIEGLTRG